MNFNVSVIDGITKRNHSTQNCAILVYNIPN